MFRNDCGMNCSEEDIMTVYKAVVSSALQAKSGGETYFRVQDTYVNHLALRAFYIKQD